MPRDDVSDQDWAASPLGSNQQDRLSLRGRAPPRLGACRRVRLLTRREAPPVVVVRAAACGQLPAAPAKRKRHAAATKQRTSAARVCQPAARLAFPLCSFCSCVKYITVLCVHFRSVPFCHATCNTSVLPRTGCGRPQAGSPRAKWAFPKRRQEVQSASVNCTKTPITKN